MEPVQVCISVGMDKLAYSCGDCCSAVTLNGLAICASTKMSLKNNVNCKISCMKLYRVP